MEAKSPSEMELCVDGLVADSPVALPVGRRLAGQPAPSWESRQRIFMKPKHLKITYEK
jgi:hypothetical protein